MKATRLNKTNKDASKTIKTLQVIENHVDKLIGRSVMLKSIPTHIKQAKHIFKLGKKYKIVKPALKNHRNTLMAVNIKGKDDKVYELQFNYWQLLPEDS